MELKTFTVGQRYFQASLYKNGLGMDDSEGGYFSTRDEAEADGAEMAADRDPEYQKRHPGSITYHVREWEVCDVDADGQVSMTHTVG